MAFLSQTLAARRFAETPGQWRREAARLLTVALTTLLTWQERSRSRRSLAELDPRMLGDLGLTAYDIQREFEKPFWRA